MVGLLADNSNPWTFQPSAAGFPAAVDPVAAAAEQARLEAEQAEQARVAAAAALARQKRGFPLAAPDAASPAVAMALGQSPGGAGTYGAQNFDITGALPFGMSAPADGSGAPPPQSPQIPPSLQTAAAMVPQAPIQQTPPNVPGGSAMPPAAPMGIGGPPPVVAQDDEPATPTARQAAPAAPAPVAPPAAPASTSGIFAPLDKLGQGINDNSTLLMALGAGLAGAPNLGAGLSRGFAAALPVAQAAQTEKKKLEIQAQQKNTTIAMLRAHNVPETDIAAAVSQPELLKALIAQNFGKDKFTATQGGKDRNGNPIYGKFNPSTGEFEAFKNAGGQTDDGPDVLTEAQQNRVKAIVEGREPYPPPSSRAPDAARIREAVHTADPNFDAVNYASRQKTRNDFTSGKSAQNLTAFNTAIGHLGALDSAIDGLKNTSFPSWNRYIANPIAGQVSPDYQAAVKKFEASRTAVADELTRAFRGSGGNVHDIKQWEETINAADSPKALRAAVQQAAELLGSRVDAVGDQYNRGMGTTKDPLELLNPKAAKAFQHLREGSRGDTPAPAGLPHGTVTIGGKSVGWSVE